MFNRAALDSLRVPAGKLVKVQPWGSKGCTKSDVPRWPSYEELLEAIRERDELGRRQR